MRQVPVSFPFIHLLTLWLIAVVSGITGCRFGRSTLMDTGQESTTFFSGTISRLNKNQVDHIARSVKKIYSLTEYRVFLFAPDQQITTKQLRTLELTDNWYEQKNHTKTVFGTATIIQKNFRGFLVLTCAHVVDSPDTVFTFYPDQVANQFLQSVAVKKSQLLFLKDQMNNYLLRTIISDPVKDIAFLKGHSDVDENEIVALTIPVGNSSRLSWGSEVYVMGYPAGYQTFGKAVVSNPYPKVYADFIIDASFNPGGSGSIIFAFHPARHSLEVIGMVKSASASYMNILIPEKETHQESFDISIPYDGEIYVERMRSLHYGITFATSFNTIGAFYREHRKTFLNEGFNLDDFFGVK